MKYTKEIYGVKAEIDKQVADHFIERLYKAYHVEGDRTLAFWWHKTLPVVWMKAFEGQVPVDEIMKEEVLLTLMYGRASVFYTKDDSFKVGLMGVVGISDPKSAFKAMAPSQFYEFPRKIYTMAWDGKAYIEENGKRTYEN